MSPGVKFADADLLGMPCQLVVGAKGLARGVVEYKDRATGGVDLERGIYPIVKICTDVGIEDVEESEIAGVHQAIVEASRQRG